MKDTQTKDHPFRNTRHLSVGMRVVFGGLGMLFKVLGAVSPRVAGKLALRVFMTPTRFQAPKREQAVLDSARRSTVDVTGRAIAVKRWGEEGRPIVLLSHGWGGRASQFYALVPALVAAGFEVVGFDVPGQGDSEGKFTNMLDVSGVIATLVQQLGDVYAIIGHSFGSGTTLLAMDRHGVQAEKIVLISCFKDVQWIVQLFADAFGLGPKVVEAMRTHAEHTLAHTYGKPWHWDEISPAQTILTTDAQLLLIHDTQDHEVPYSQAEGLKALKPEVTLVSTSGLGHRRILRAPECVEAAVTFLRQEK